jgi:hypothetical protein
MTINDSKFETYINSLDEDTTPDGENDLLILLKAAGTLMKLKPDTLVSFAGGIPPDGWIAAAAMTYVGADDPTFTASMVGDVTTTYQIGQRIKLTQSTGGTKYFIITKVAYSSVTTLTLYGGTDYNLNNEAITNPYYSPVKAPFGFPLNPTKWTEEYSGNGAAAQANPVDGTWYNLGGSLSIPIGVWNVEHNFMAQGTSTDPALEWICTLSTANNTSGSAPFLIGFWSAVINAGHNNTNEAYIHGVRTGVLALTTKTVYYGNIKEDYAPNMTSINLVYNIIRAVCAYL